MSAEPYCPRCNGPVVSNLTCHTWPKNYGTPEERWMSCLPCDSAVRWHCVAWQQEDYQAQDDGWMFEDDEGVGCGWSWTDGLNPGNPRAAENALNKPDWSESA